MDIFEKNPEDLRLEFRRALIKKLKGAPKIKFPLKERIQLERKFFGEKSNKTISEDDYKSSLLELDRAKYKARTEKERVNIEKKVRFLKKLGGIKKLKESSKIMPQVKIKEKKEVKKDLSAFQGKLYLERNKIRRWLKRPEAWQITKIPVKNRPALERKLFDPKRFGSFIDKREAGIVYKDFENYPERVKKRYGIKGKNERVRTFKLLKKFLGK